MLKGWGQRGFNLGDLRQRAAPADAERVCRWRLLVAGMAISSRRTTGRWRLPISPVQRHRPATNCRARWLSGERALQHPQAGFTRPPDNYLTYAKDYGSQTENWQGVDFSVNAACTASSRRAASARAAGSTVARSGRRFESSPLNHTVASRAPLTQSKAARRSPSRGSTCGWRVRSRAGPVVRLPSYILRQYCFPRSAGLSSGCRCGR